MHAAHSLDHLLLCVAHLCRVISLCVCGYLLLLCTYQARHTGIKIVQQIAILIGCAVLPHLKEMVTIIEHGLTDEQQKGMFTIIYFSHATSHCLASSWLSKVLHLVLYVTTVVSTHLG